MPSPARRFAVLAVLPALVLPLAGLARAGGPVATALRITVPAAVPAGSAADVWVRLVHPGEGGEDVVANRPVLVQRQTPNGWAQVTSLTTNSNGLAHGPVTIASTSRLRAFFRGDAAYATSTSREVVVTATSTFGQRVVAEAKRHRGATYAYGAAGPNHFDCSGFTMYVFSRLGKRLPHNSSQQAHAVRAVSAAAKRPGDLIFTYHGSTIGHVGIYAGGSQMWASVQSGDVVRLQSFASRSYRVGRVA